MKLRRLYYLFSCLTGKEISIGIVGLGYVGLPLAVAFGQTHPVVGFDIDDRRVRELMDGYDATLEMSKE